jgi:hypothetical protein
MPFSILRHGIATTNDTLTAGTPPAAINANFLALANLFDAVLTNPIGASGLTINGPLIASNGITFADATVQTTAATGGVTSVAGRPGAVTLAESDIANLTTDLASKISSSNLTLAGHTMIGSGTNTVTLATTGSTNVTLPTSGTLATTYQLTQYLPLTGGIVTGAIQYSNLNYVAGTIPYIEGSNLSLVTTAGNTLDDGSGNATVVGALSGHAITCTSLTVTGGGAVNFGSTQAVTRSLSLQGVSGVNSGNTDFSLRDATGASYFDFFSDSTGRVAVYNANNSAIPFYINNSNVVYGQILQAGNGWSGTFTTANGKTVTVQSGIITNCA